MSSHFISASNNFNHKMSETISLRHYNIYMIDLAYRTAQLGLDSTIASGLILPRLIAIAASHWSTGDYSFDLSSILYNTRINYLKTIRFHCFGSCVSCHVWEAEKVETPNTAFYDVVITRARDFTSDHNNYKACMMVGHKITCKPTKTQ